jgi:hypothetical protein
MLALGTAASMLVSSARATPIADEVVDGAPPAKFETFLDRLMAAESGGRSNAKNPRSSALGPFQFIKSTFLEVTRRHFPDEIAGLEEDEILGLRSNQDLARRAAAAYCKDSAAFLKEQGLEPTFTHLRLAYLLGPAGAAIVMRADGHEQVAQLLSATVIKANPFMRRMSVADLLAKSEHDISSERRLARDTHDLASPAPSPIARPRARVMPADSHARRATCNPKLASCRKFQELAKKSRRKVRVGAPGRERGRSS